MKPAVFGYLIVAFVFVVTWQEYQLEHHEAIHKPGPADKNGYVWTQTTTSEEYYTVETVEHSIKLKTQKDVDLFVGEISSNGKVAFLHQHIIPTDAFNIKVHKEKP